MSEELNTWLNSIGFRHLYSPPYHPASNGQVERGGRSFKEKERVLRHITDFGKRTDNVLVALNSGSGADMKVLHRKILKPVTCTSNDKVFQTLNTPYGSESSMTKRRSRRKEWQRILDHLVLKELISKGNFGGDRPTMSRRELSWRMKLGL